MLKHHCHGSPEQHHIQPYGPVVDIPAVHLYSFRIVDVAAAAGLPHSGDAGKDGIVFFDIFPISWHFCLYDRPRSHEAHFPFQHVPELGQFVEAGLSEEGAALCNAGIILQFEFSIPFRLGFRVGGQEVFQDFFGVDAHGTEFVAVEFFSISSYPSMFKDDRPRGIVVDPEGDGKENRRDHEAADDGGGEVEGSFQDTVPAVAQIVPDVQYHDFGIEEGFYSDVGHGNGDEVWNDCNVFDKGLGTVDKVGEFILRKAGRGDEDGVYTCFSDCFFQVVKAAQDGHFISIVPIGLSVFQKSYDPIAHARISSDLTDKDVCCLSGTHDEDGYLEGSDVFNHSAGNDSCDGEKDECKDSKEQDKKTGHLS